MIYKDHVIWVTNEDTPQRWLLFSTVLNHRTSPSGHNHLRQNSESTSTVKPWGVEGRSRRRGEGERGKEEGGRRRGEGGRDWEKMRNEKKKKRK